MTGRWTTPADIRAKTRRLWDSGALLAAFAAEAPFPAVDVPVRGPRAAEIGDDLAAVQGWVAELEAGSRRGRCYDIEYATIGGRHFGRNRVPSRVRVDTYDQAWRLLGVSADVVAYQRILDLAAPTPAVRAWTAVNPLRALPLADDWVPLLAAYGWLVAARGSGRALREITAPGVDTKFVERHRVVLADLLGVGRTPSAFVGGLGLRGKLDMVRLRCDPAAMGLPAGLTEATLRVDEAATLAAHISVAIVIENETTYLAVPVPRNGVVLWGKGFEASNVGRLPWLADREVHYWGDLDTHGFAILDQLRAWLPQARSFLMDRETLLEHRERWVTEPTPTSARLARLDSDESALYADLVSDLLGDAVRLEQERVDWRWVRERLPYPVELDSGCPSPRIVISRKTP
jgi:hypothetical protein